MFVQTYIGPVLISVNPFKGLPIYTQKEIDMYQMAVSILTIVLVCNVKFSDVNDLHLHNCHGKTVTTTLLACMMY